MKFFTDKYILYTFDNYVFLLTATTVIISTMWGPRVDHVVAMAYVADLATNKILFSRLINCMLVFD